MERSVHINATPQPKAITLSAVTLDNTGLTAFEQGHFPVGFVAQLVKNPPAMRETWVRSLGWDDLWRRERLPTPVFWTGEFHGLYGPWGCKESDTTKRLSLEASRTKIRMD